MFQDDPPDMLLLETGTLIREPATYEMVELLLETGLPVWLSYRRCRHGVCGVYGQHWGPPEGDLFGRAARRFEEMGVEALLINCLPVDHVPGIVSWLRDFTEMPLGVYPNLGHLAGKRWRFDDTIGPEAYAGLALGWRDEGAQIVGGCCGVTCDHIAALGPALAETKPGRRRPQLEERLRSVRDDAAALDARALARRRRHRPLPAPAPGSHARGGRLRPHAGELPGLEAPLPLGHRLSACAASTSAAAAASRRCSSRSTAPSTCTRSTSIATRSRTPSRNAYRNGVGDRVSGDDVDLYQWTTEDRYDLIVASLFQMPVDPYEEPSGHRPLDYWGRNQLDHFLSRLPKLLTADGKALVMQLSIVGQAATSQRLAHDGLRARVVDFTFFPFGPLFAANKPQIERVEQISDAYHLKLGGDDVMVAYLIEVSRVADEPQSDNGV